MREELRKGKVRRGEGGTEECDGGKGRIVFTDLVTLSQYT